MDKVKLGNTGIEISPLGLGTVKFGRNSGVKYPSKFDLPDESFLKNFLTIAKELGINMLDTAPSYGTSEERLGRLLQRQRHEWVIIGKAGEEYENGVSSFDFTPSYFETSLHRSLKRLNTDYLDVFLIHSDGSDLQILENDALLKKLLSFKERGLVRAIGASTKTVMGGLKAAEILDVIMITYNLADRREEPVLDLAYTKGIGVLLKKALMSGHINTLDSLNPIKESLKFGFDHPATSGIIIGTIDTKHLETNVRVTKEIFLESKSRLSILGV